LKSSRICFDRAIILPFLASLFAIIGSHSLINKDFNSRLLQDEHILNIPNIVTISSSIPDVTNANYTDVLSKPPTQKQNLNHKIKKRKKNVRTYHEWKGKKNGNGIPDATNANYTNVLSKPKVRSIHNTGKHHYGSQCSRNLANTPLSITLVTQTTFDRLPVLSFMCKRWSSPISAVVYMSSIELQSWEETEVAFLFDCPNVVLVPYEGINGTEKLNSFPINKLRNLALNQVWTSHVLVVDVDFIPSTGLDKSVMSTVKTINDGQNKSIPYNQYALVVPAFERLFPLEPPCQNTHDCLSIATAEGSDFIPRSMTSLRSCITDKGNGECIAFRSNNFVRGHGPTESNEWLQKNDTQNHRPVSSFSDGYEPYVIIPWCPTVNSNRNYIPLKKYSQDPWAPLSPYYDERFLGYGKNKVQQTQHLNYRGYTFSVIPAVGFLVHLPHEKSIVAQKWMTKNNYAMYFLFLEYKKELTKKYSEKNKKHGEDD